MSYEVAQMAIAAGRNTHKSALFSAQKHSQKSHSALVFLRKMHQRAQSVAPYGVTREGILADALHTQGGMLIFPLHCAGNLSHWQEARR